MTDINWMNKIKPKDAEYQPHEDVGYDHPEENFFPEINLPTKAKEEDYQFPSVIENEIIQREIDRISTWSGKGIV